MIELRFTKNEFELAYRRYMEEGGHSYDPWDLATAWSHYCKEPKEYDWLPSLAE